MKILFKRIIKDGDPAKFVYNITFLCHTGQRDAVEDAWGKQNVVDENAKVTQVNEDNARLINRFADLKNKGEEVSTDLLLKVQKIISESLEEKNEKIKEKLYPAVEKFFAEINTLFPLIKYWASSNKSNINSGENVLKSLKNYNGSDFLRFVLFYFDKAEFIKGISNEERMEELINILNTKEKFLSINIKHDIIKSFDAMVSRI